MGLLKEKEKQPPLIQKGLMMPTVSVASLYGVTIRRATGALGPVCLRYSIIVRSLAACPMIDSVVLI